MATSGDGEFIACDSWVHAQILASGYEDPRVVGHLAHQLQRNPPWASTSRDLELSERAVEFLCAFQVALGNSTRVRVIDYGGGNGYFGVWVKRLLKNVNLEWIVVESPSICSSYSRIPHPRWLSWMPEERLVEVEADIFVASCALHYVADPWSVLNSSARNSKFAVLMRLPLLHESMDHCAAIQRPSGAGVYPEGSSWPCWFFSAYQFDAFVQTKFSEVYRWTTWSETWEFMNKEVRLQGRLLSSV